MKLQMTRGNLTKPGLMKLLFGLCWAAYASAYLGRLNYAASLVEISRTQGWDKGAAGLVATAFFAAYGLGQLINGIVGDKLSPRYMVSFGLVFSGVVNLAFPFIENAGVAAVLWGINGFVQSMIWSPLIRLVSEWMPAEKRLAACANMNTTAPIGTLLAYGLSSCAVWLGSWKLAFFVSGAVLLTVGAVFFTGVGILDGKVQAAQYSEEKLKQGGTEKVPFLKLALMTAVPMIAVAALMQGMLKDGITTWIPTFLEEQFGITAAWAILSTAVVPIVNLCGVYLASWLNRKMVRNEILSAAYLFGAAVLALVLLSLFPGSSAVLSLILLALATTFMMGISVSVVGMMPSYYVHYGVCSTASGVFNSAVYIGSAISTYLNGAFVELKGWNFMMWCWCGMAVAGMVMSLLSAGKWGKFRKEMDHSAQ